MLFVECMTILNSVQALCVVFSTQRYSEHGVTQRNVLTLIFGLWIWTFAFQTSLFQFSANHSIFNDFPSQMIINQLLYETTL